jgi:hypothetical protein
MNQKVIFIEQATYDTYSEEEKVISRLKGEKIWATGGVLGEAGPEMWAKLSSRLKGSVITQVEALDKYLLRKAK